MRILHVIYGLNIGGAETFIYNILSNLNEKEYHIDLVIQNSEIYNLKLYELCKSKGCEIFIVPKFNKDFFSYIREMRKVLSHSYDIIHIHMNALINIVPVLLGKKRESKIVLHSHNTCNNQGGKIGKIVHFLNRVIINRLDTVNIACGRDAGKWMFGNEVFQILDNAVSIGLYQYSEKNRSELNKKLGIKGEKVIGHVGRFVEAKNHRFILNLFCKYLKKYPESILVLVGDGILRKEMERLAEELKIADKVRFEGSKMDVQHYYSCFDCLLFPSNFEGLPFVLIEAQASGLPIIASTNVTKEVNVTDNITFLSLQDDMERWLECIEKALQKKDRLSYTKKMKSTRYDIDVLIDKVETIYNK